MEFSDEMKAAIEAKAAEIAEAKTQEIVKQVTEESEKKIATLTEKHAAEIKTYKDSIAAIISGKGEEKPEKTKMETLVDAINAKRLSNKLKKEN